MSWNKHWEELDIPWDAGSESPTMRDFAATIPSGRALVPGAGSGHDAFALAEAGHHVTALDIAEAARTTFESARDKRGISSSQCRLDIADFFQYSPEENFDLIWDYTFLCAIDPSERTAWAKKMSSLLQPRGYLATLVFPIIDPGADYKGPPWPLSPEGVKALLDNDFELVSSKMATDSHPGREGKECLCIWKLREPA